MHACRKGYIAGEVLQISGVCRTQKTAATYLWCDSDDGCPVFHDETQTRIRLGEDDRHGANTAAYVDDYGVLVQLVPRETCKYPQIRPVATSCCAVRYDAP